jgi:hypothetical protein
MFFKSNPHEGTGFIITRFFVLCFLGFYTIGFQSVSIAQNIELSESTGNIKEKSIKGFTVCLELDAKSVESGLSRFLKSIGKFDKAERQAWAGLTQVIPSISSDAVDFFARLTVSPRCIQVFMGASRSGTESDLGVTEKENLRKLVYEFSLEQYRSDYKKQISEAERVVNLAVKAHDKRTQEGDDIKYRLSRNRKNKIRLQEELEENAREFQKLTSDSVRNSSEKETALEEIKKVRLIAEEKKLRLGQVK